MELILKKVTNKIREIIQYFQMLFSKEEKDTHEQENKYESSCENDENIGNAITCRKTIKDEIYCIEQMINVFEVSRPQKFQYFKQRIEKFREKYVTRLTKVKQELTFEIDPELSVEMHQEIYELRQAVQDFIDTELMYENIHSKLNILITKLIVVYNSMMKHSEIAEPALKQIDNAKNVELCLAEKLKSCDYILRNKQLKGRITQLFAYADYLILKCVLRGTTNSPEDEIKNMLICKFFVGFEYVTSVKAFIEDEVSDYRDVVPKLMDEKFQNVVNERISKLLTDLACSESVYYTVTKRSTWDELFELENMIRDLTIYSGTESFEIKLLERMCINVKQENAIKSIKQIVYLELIKLYACSNDDNVWLLLKFWNNVNEEITYKYMYYLFQLFDVIPAVQKCSFYHNIERYVSIYPCESISKRKEKVFHTEPKEYMYAFDGNDDEIDRIINTLTKLNIDFKYESGTVFINRFYFNGIEQKTISNQEKNMSDETM